MNKGIMFSVVISAMLLLSCSKEKTPPTPTGEEIIRTFGPADIGEVVYTSFNFGSDQPCEWSVIPSNTAKVFAMAQSAQILFTAPGLYTVTARTKPFGKVAVDTIRVGDSVYSRSPLYDPVEMYPEDLRADEVLTLTPVSIRGDMLVFYAVTKYIYFCSPQLIYHNNTTSTAVKIDFLGVPSMINAYCIANPYPPRSYCFVHTRGYANGTHDITIRVGKALTTYTGTLTVTDDKYIFNWPDNIPVVITAKQIDRVK